MAELLTLFDSKVRRISPTSFLKRIAVIATSPEGNGSGRGAGAAAFDGTSAFSLDPRMKRSCELIRGMAACEGQMAPGWQV